MVDVFMEVYRRSTEQIFWFCSGMIIITITYKHKCKNICLWVNCVVLHRYRCILLRFYCSFLCIVDVVCITRCCCLVIFVSNYFLVGLILTETHHLQVLTLILSNMPITLPKNPQYFTSSDSDTSSLFADSNEF